MTDKEITLDYLKTIRWIHTLAGIIDVPILILVYWLGYHYAFALLLLLFTLNEFAFAYNVSKLENILNLN